MNYRQMETLYQQWLMMPRTYRPDDNKVVKPLFLFRYLGGYRIGAVNRMVLVSR